MRASRFPIVIAVVAVLALATGPARGASEPSAEPDDGFVPPSNLERGWYARIETDVGRILIQLLPEQAPQSVAYFAGLANGTLGWVDPVTGETQKAHYYDGITVDLVKAGERFEAGGLEGEPSRVPPRFFVPPTDGHGPVSFNVAGRIGMTRSYGARISGVKFFITAAALPHLSGPHPCFGYVVEGRDIVFAISGVKSYGNGRPIEPITIRKIRVFPVGDPDPLPEPRPYRPTLKRFEAKERD